MTTVNPTRPPIPPIVCAPWCEHGDGHTKEWCREHQTCWGSSTYVLLSRELADVDLEGNPYPARLGAMAHRGHNEAAEVYLHADLPASNVDVNVGLMAVEARQLADALISVADTIEGGDKQDDNGEGRVEAYHLRDARRRIRNILDRFPASGWGLEESEAVLAALAKIVRGRPESERLT